VRQFVNENAGKLFAGGIESDPAVAQEGAAMDRSAYITQAVGGLDANGVPENRRQTAQDRLRPAFQGRVFKPERI